MALVCASTDDGRPLTGGTNLIWMVVDGVTSGSGPCIMRAGGYYHYAFRNRQQAFTTKEPNKHDARRISARHTPLQKGSFGCCAVEKHVAFIATLIRFFTMLLIRRKKKDILRRRKSMQMADEKLIIN